MKNKIPEMSSIKRNSRPDKGPSGSVEKELSEDELSEASGGKSSSLASACVTGKHLPNLKIT